MRELLGDPIEVVLDGGGKGVDVREVGLAAFVDGTCLGLEGGNDLLAFVDEGGKCVGQALDALVVCSAAGCLVLFVRGCVLFVRDLRLFCCGILCCLELGVDSFLLKVVVCGLVRHVSSSSVCRLCVLQIIPARMRGDT
jgi:hypothetical protein